ncbi:MAG TPA: VWA domain-containing protein [Planctomycetota bacterium]|jgi:hypothetical protein
MSLLAPAMLAGAAALAVPVVLHLIARHRFPIQDFPSVRLLQYERRTNVFAWKIVDLKQLLLRLLVLALLVLAMARFFSPSLSSDPAPRNLVIVVDASASMRMTGKSLESGSRESGVSKTLLEHAKGLARELLQEVRSPSRCALVVAGQNVDVLSTLEPGSERALSALGSIEACDGAGPGLIRAIARCGEMLRGRREFRSQIVVLTDVRASAFEARDQRDLQSIEQTRRDLGAHLDVAVIDVSGGVSENLAILDARVRGGEVQAGDDVHVVAHVARSATAGTEARPTAGTEAGATGAQTAELRLSIGGQSDPQPRGVALAAGAEAFVDMTLRVNRAQRAFGSVSLKEHDALPQDDQFLVPVNVADVQRVLLVWNPDEHPAGSGTQPRGVGGDLSRLGTDARAATSSVTAGRDAGTTSVEEQISGATILRYVLNPGRELGASYSSGIDTTVVTAETLSAQPLSKYDVVALYDVSSLPEKCLQDLDTFVRQGKSVLLFCSAACSPLHFNKSLAAGTKDRPPLAPVQIGNDRLLNPPAGIDPACASHPLLAPFRDRMQGDLSVIRFASVREIRGQPEGAKVVLRAMDGTPLAVEREVGQGHVMLLTFGLELDRGNIARCRVFPAFMSRVVQYLSGRLAVRPPDVLPAGEMRVLDVSELPFALETSLDLTRIEGAEARASSPAGRDAGPTTPTRTLVERLPISPERQVVLKGLPTGQYLIHKSQNAGNAQVLSYARPVTVNADPRESCMTPIAGTELQALLGPETRILSPSHITELAPRGGEFWTLLVALLALAYCIEALAGWIACVRNRQQSGVAPASLLAGAEAGATPESRSTPEGTA